jgi:hypothetical protein
MTPNGSVTEVGLGRRDADVLPVAVVVELLLPELLLAELLDELLLLLLLLDVLDVLDRLGLLEAEPPMKYPALVPGVPSGMAEVPLVVDALVLVLLPVALPPVALPPVALPAEEPPPLAALACLLAWLYWMRNRAALFKSMVADTSLLMRLKIPRATAACSIRSRPACA